MIENCTSEETFRSDDKICQYKVQRGSFPLALILTLSFVLAGDAAGEGDLEPEPDRDLDRDLDPEPDLDMGLLDLDRERDETERETDLESERETDRERDLIEDEADGITGQCAMQMREFIKLPQWQRCLKRIRGIFAVPIIHW